MSDIERPDKNVPSPEEEEPNEHDHTQSVIAELMQGFMLKAFQSKTEEDGIGLGRLDKEQIDLVLKTMAQESEYTHNYNMELIKLEHDLEKRRLDATQVGQKTYRYIVLAIVLFGLGFTFVLLFIRPDFWKEWLSFASAVVGGFGLSKLLDLQTTNTSSSSNPKDIHKNAERERNE